MRGLRRLPEDFPMISSTAENVDCSLESDGNRYLSALDRILRCGRAAVPDRIPRWPVAAGWNDLGQIISGI